MLRGGVSGGFHGNESEHKGIRQGHSTQRRCLASQGPAGKPIQQVVALEGPRSLIPVPAKATGPMSRINALAGSERTQGKPLQCRTDSNWPTTLITELWKMGTQGICLNRKSGRTSSNQPAWVLFLTCLSPIAVTDEPLQELTLAQVKPEPISYTGPKHSSQRLQLWRLETVCGFPVSTCHFYLLLHFHSFPLPAPTPSLDSTVHR